MSESNNGTLIIIGGAEDKKADKAILKEVLKNSGGQNAHIILVTTATSKPEEVSSLYKRSFGELGAKKITSTYIARREDANNEQTVEEIASADCVFFVGGDQLRISSILGGTEVHKKILELYSNGKVIAGTSAGASMMSEIMVVEGEDDAAPSKCTLKMAPGMGLLNGVIIDQHFNQRGRIGRLLAAVAQNPNVLGIGIDEDTAIVVKKDLTFTVHGSGVATVVDGRNIRYTNTSEQYPNEPLAITNVTVHVFPKEYGFNILTREEIVNIEQS